MNSRVAPIYHIAEVQMIRFAAFSCFRGSVQTDIDINILSIHMRYIMIYISMKSDYSGII